MAGNKQRLIAWDSCIFLAWFKGEEDKPLGEIELLLRDVNDGKIVLLISSIVVAEVLDDVTSQSDVGTRFREFYRRTKVARANADFRVAELAASFREAAKQALNNGEITKSIKAPDALIAATAKLYKAEALHSFDPVLLELSETTILGGLKVVRPDSGHAHNEPLFDQG